MAGPAGSTRTTEAPAPSSATPAGERRLVHARCRRITEAVNAASLNEVTDPTTATAYSLGQQLIVTAWNQVVAIVMLVWAFGWSGGKQLVRDSYGQAKEQAAEQTEAHKRRRAEKKAAADAGDDDASTPGSAG